MRARASRDQLESIDIDFDGQKKATPSKSLVRPEGFTHYRWVVVGLCFAIVIINYMDRTAISYAIEPLKVEFKLDNTKFGEINSAFSIGYTVMTLIGGVMVDRWGARKCWSGAAMAWSAATGLLAVCSGFAHLFLLRIMLGITEGPCFPAMTRAITDWMPVTERARASAICLAAVSLASVIGAPLISFLINNFGWRTMFVVLSSFGMIWAVVWWLFFFEIIHKTANMYRWKNYYILTRAKLCQLNCVLMMKFAGTI